MHLEKRLWGDFCDGSNRYLVVGVANIRVTDGRGLSLWFLTVWSVGSSADNYFTGKKITGFLPPPTHSPWKQTPFMIQKRPHHFIHKVMCFFFLRKCHHYCFCCSCSFILWHFSVVRSFPQLELFSSASHGHKKIEHSFHFSLHIWADLGGKNLCRNGGWKAATRVLG